MRLRSVASGVCAELSYRMKMGRWRKKLTSDVNNAVAQSFELSSDGNSMAARGAAYYIVPRWVSAYIALYARTVATRNDAGRTTACVFYITGLHFCSNL